MARLFRFDFHVADASIGKPASRNEVSTAHSDEIAVVQALELLNGHILNELIDPATLSPRGARPDLRKAIDRIYRVTLSRPATLEEKKVGQAFLNSAHAMHEGVADMLWALLVSPEFQFIH